MCDGLDGKMARGEGECNIGHCFLRFSTLWYALSRLPTLVSGDCEAGSAVVQDGTVHYDSEG